MDIIEVHKDVITRVLNDLLDKAKKVYGKSPKRTGKKRPVSKRKRA